MSQTPERPPVTPAAPAKSQEPIPKIVLIAQDDELIERFSVGVQSIWPKLFENGVGLTRLILQEAGLLSTDAETPHELSLKLMAVGWQQFLPSHAKAIPGALYFTDDEELVGVVAKVGTPGPDGVEWFETESGTRQLVSRVGYYLLHPKACRTCALRTFLRK